MYVRLHSFSTPTLDAVLSLTSRPISVGERNSLAIDRSQGGPDGSSVFLSVTAIETHFLNYPIRSLLTNVTELSRLTIKILTITIIN